MLFSTRHLRISSLSSRPSRDLSTRSKALVVLTPEYSSAYFLSRCDFHRSASPAVCWPSWRWKRGTEAAEEGRVEMDERDFDWATGRMNERPASFLERRSSSYIAQRSRLFECASLERWRKK